MISTCFDYNYKVAVGILLLCERNYTATRFFYNQPYFWGTRKIAQKSSKKSCLRLAYFLYKLQHNSYFYKKNGKNADLFVSVAYFKTKC